MSVLVLAGAAQFAAVGLVAAGAPWIGIVLLTAFLNARHLLYAAALAPWMAKTSRVERALSAHVLTDETFALALAHARRVGAWDSRGYWVAAALDLVPWVVATGLGFVAAQAVPDPERFGLDVVFPAAMGGLAVALIAGRRDLAAALAGAAIGIFVGLATQPVLGIVAGGLLGPLLALLLPAGTGRPAEA